MNVIDLVRESNKIEGILRDPTEAEVAEFDRFVALPRVTVRDLQDFVTVYQPNARLRDAHGLNVRVGHHVPIAGGPEVRIQLIKLLSDIGAGNPPWETHVRYETLHPFTDGNGRSGRMLWYWQMAADGLWETATSLGFLHAFYYQTLANVGRQP